MSMKQHYTKLFYVLVSLSAVGASAQGLPDRDRIWPILNGVGATGSEIQRTNESTSATNLTQAEEPVTTINADSISGQRTEQMTASGKAEVKRGDQTVRADMVKYFPQTEDVIAEGNVTFLQPGLRLVGEQLRFSLAKNSGEMSNVEYAIEENNAHGVASKVYLDDEEHQRVESATYSTCDIREEDVYLKTKLLELDRGRDVGAAKHSVVVFKGVPILYTPYLTFPLSTNRKSGFLTPSYGQSVENGFEFEIPFYWNIAPNYDATFTTRYLSDRGTQLKSQWRYLGNQFDGQIQYDHIADDQLFSESRRNFYHLAHSQKISENFSGDLLLQGVSDDSYFKDLSTDVAVTSQVHLPRRLGLNAHGDKLNAQFEMLHYQSLSFASPPFEKDPSLKVTISPSVISEFETGGFFETTRYSHPTIKGATRSILSPYLQLPYENDFSSITPKIQYHMTYYDSQDGSSSKRTMPIYSLDSSVVFERNIDIGESGLIQTLEPRIFYAYAPFRDQSQLPNFDSGLKGFDFSSIFTDNLFSGDDRINDADHVTVGMTSRFFENSSGIERLRLSGAQRYFNSGNHVANNTANRSDILFGATGKLSQSWAIDSLLQYSGVLSRVQKHQHSILYTPLDGSVIKFSHRSERDSLEQYDISIKSAISGLWSTAARWNFSKDSSKLIEGLMGLEYDNGCWGWRLVVSRVLLGQNENNHDRYATQVLMQLDLKGFTRIGQNAMGLLREKVTGYED